MHQFVIFYSQDRSFVVLATISVELFSFDRCLWYNPRIWRITIREYKNRSKLAENPEYSVNSYQFLNLLIAFRQVRGLHQRQRSKLSRSHSGNWSKLIFLSTANERSSLWKIRKWSVPNTSQSCHLLTFKKQKITEIQLPKSRKKAEDIF